jgi:hypothetical protein
LYTAGVSQIDHFNSYVAEPDNENSNGRFQAAFDATFVADCNFRIVCASTDGQSFCFLGAQLYCQHQPAAFEFVIDVQPGNVIFPHNLLPTLWEDVSATAAEKRIKIFNPADQRQMKLYSGALPLIQRRGTRLLLLERGTLAMT